MKTSRKKWWWLSLAASLLPLTGWTCTTSFRDAVMAGAFDFVSGTVTELLTRLLPLAEAAGQT